MFVDALDLAEPETLATDLCVVGAGAAGIPLALEFADTSVGVVLLESGGASDDAKGQGIYTIVSGSRPRLVLDPARRRYFGGNTNHWFGNCRPLDEADFERREWIPHSGWPIHREEVLPFYQQAHGLCGLGDFRCYDLDACRSALTHQPIEVDRAKLVNRVMHTCPVFSFGDLYRAQLRAADNIRVCLRARATKIETDAAGGTVRAVQGVTADGRRFRVRAKVFVLAAGGIENARLLLDSTDGKPHGLGNDHDLVGRFFMEHPYLDIPLGEADGGPGVLFYSGRQQVGTTIVWGQFSLSEALMREERVTGLSLWFQRVPRVAPSVVSASRLRDLVLGRAWPADPLTEIRTVLGNPRDVLDHVWRRLGRRNGAGGCGDGYALRVLLEQAPDPRNRVQLSARRDGHGQRRAELVLRLTDDSRRRHDRALRIAADEVGLDGERIARQMRQAVNAGRADFFWHHMGTTRMHKDPVQGVVDANCRVHGVSNLFVAGSSIFPTSGTAAPTLTIVALALRLARHLRQNHL